MPSRARRGVETGREGLKFHVWDLFVHHMHPPHKSQDRDTGGGNRLLQRKLGIKAKGTCVILLTWESGSRDTSNTDSCRREETVVQ